MSDESPKTDGKSTSDGNMFKIVIFLSIVGHSMIVNERLWVCKISYADMNLAETEVAIKTVPLGRLEWLVGNESGVASCVKG